MRLIAFLYGLLAAALVVVASCAPVYAGMAIAPGTPNHTHSDANTGGGTLALSGTLSSTKSCASGYTRAGPNLCMRVSAAQENWANSSACVGRTIGASLPADATAAVISLNWVARSNNAIGVRTNFVIFYRDTTCTSAATSSVSHFELREFAAVAAGTILGRYTSTMIVPLPATSTIYAAQSNAGGNGNAEIENYYVIGYLD